MTPLVGKQFYLFGDTTETYTLGASLEVVRYSDYEQAWNSYSMVKLLPENWYDVGLELCVRVKEDQDKDFITRLKADSEKLYRVGNVFIAEVRSLMISVVTINSHKPIPCAAIFWVWFFYC